jgi:hypothetical protein
MPYKTDPRLFGHKPFIDYKANIAGKRKWRCRLYHARFNRVIMGRGATIQAAYKDYEKVLAWHRRKQPYRLHQPKYIL